MRDRIASDFARCAEIHFTREEKLVEVAGPFAAADVCPATVIGADKDGDQYRRNEDGSWVLFKKDSRLFLSVHPPATVSAEFLELCRLLKLRPGLTKYEVTVGSIDVSAQFGSRWLHRVQMVPRSTVQATFYMSHGVAVPSENTWRAALPCKLPFLMVRLLKGPINEGLFWCTPVSSVAGRNRRGCRQVS